MQDRADAAEAGEFLGANPDIRHVQILLTDNNGVLRGKSLRPHELPPIYERGRPLPSSIVALTIQGEDAEDTGLVWEVGDMDCLAFPVPGTLRRCPWLAVPTAQVLLTLDPVLGLPAAAGDPRLAAVRVCERLHADGYFPVVAIELEFYLLDGTRGAAGEMRPAAGAGGRRPLYPHVYGIDDLESFKPVLDDLYSACDAQGLPAETAISEYAPGQIEITLAHRTDALRALDDAVMYRRLVKGVAARHGLLACFMAKPFAGHSGSGCHVHVSLNDSAGNNLFATSEPAGTRLLRHAIGGMSATMADAMAFFAPHANSYRRFIAQSYAPLAPTWGVNNRSVALRIPSGPAALRHVEHRVCGADANPYLAAAAVLAGMHHGIRHEIDPGPPVTGNGYATEDVQSLPHHWPEAIERLACSTVLREYLGERCVDIYVAVKRTECKRFLSEVREQDYDWYLHAV